MRPPPASPRAAGALSRLVAAVVLIVAPLAPAPWVRDAHAAAHPPVTARRAMVAADSAVASRIGLDILHAGGDAVDAAVATALVLGVVQPFASGLGGGGFALVFRADAPSAPPFTLDFRETAPAAATADMYLDARGEVVPKASTHGPRAAAVPGELAGLYAVHRRFGRLPWARVVEPALRLARDGFPASGLLALRIARQREAIAGVPAWPSTCSTPMADRSSKASPSAGQPSRAPWPASPATAPMPSIRATSVERWSRPWPATGASSRRPTWRHTASSNAPRSTSTGEVTASTACRHRAVAGRSCFRCSACSNPTTSPPSATTRAGICIV